MTTAQDEWHAIVRNISQSPLEDLPRLVAADWLDETSDPGNERHAKLIRAQCELAAPERPSQKRTAQLKRAVREALLGSITMRSVPFVATILDDWELGIWVDGWAYCAATGENGSCHVRRGFVDELWVPIDAFVSLAGPVFRVHPVSCLTITGREPFSHPPPQGTTGWQRRSSSLRAWNGRLPAHCFYDIPDEVFELLAGHDDDLGGNAKRYGTTAAAKDALSRACLAYGRAKADEPTVKQQGD